MIDVEPMILEELQQLAPLEPAVRDWADVRERARTVSADAPHPGREEPGRRLGWRHGPRPSRRRRVAFGAVVVVAIGIVPAVAFSASVRNVLGFGRWVEPNYRQAQLMVSTPLPGGRVARLWVGPSNQGGQCEFVTYAPAQSIPDASRMGGIGDCTVGAHRFLGTLSWAFSSASKTTPPVISGRASNSVHPARVELRWHGGSLLLASRDGYFIGVSAALSSPSFRQLPYDVVVLDGNGKVSARSRIPTSFLYRNWKQVQPRLHRYRVAHGCGTKIIWQCKSR